MTADLHALVESYLDGDVDSAGCAALESLLLADPAAAVLYAERVTLRRHLAERFAFDEREWAAGSPPRIEPATVRPVRSGWSAGLAAAILIGGLAATVAGIVLLAVRASHDAQPVAIAQAPRVGVVIDTPDAIWGTEPVYPGDDLRRQIVRLDAGLLAYTSGSGVTVSIRGPATATMHAADRVELTSGRLRAEVPSGSAGFTVDGPRGWSVVDLGTRFDVEVSPDGRMRVVVDEGRVVLRSPGGKETEVAAGDGRIIHSDDHVVAPSDDAWLRWRLAMGRLRADDTVLEIYDFEDDAESAVHLHNATPGAGRFDDRALWLAGDGYASIDGPGEMETFTLSAWVKPEQIDTDMTGLVMATGWGAAEIHWQLHAGRAKMNVEGQPEIVASKPVQAGRWNHVTATFDGPRGLMVLYLDGEAVAEQEIAPGSKAVLGAATIGAWLPRELEPGVEYARPLRGGIDEIVIHSQAMSADAVRDMYRATRPDDQRHDDRGPIGKEAEHDANEE